MKKGTKLDSQLDGLEQYGRRQNLGAHGMPMAVNETNVEV